MTSETIRRSRSKTSTFAALAAAAVTVVLAVAAPLVALVPAAIGSGMTFIAARRTGERLYWWLFAIFLAAFLVAGLIDLTLLAAGTGVSPAHPVPVGPN